jgi:ABC-2 type transport system ATP-binding protein
MIDNHLVVCEGLRIARGGFALDIPKLEIPTGSVVGLVGENGAGKTTLLEALAGLRPVDAGAVRVFGRDPWKDPVYVRSRLGFMADDMPVFDMRIGKLLKFLSGYYPTWDPVLVDDLVAKFALDPGARSDRLSKGEGTRLRLVMAMAFRPQLLLLDEPATGLDLKGRRALLEEVLGIVRDPQRTVVISSHDLADLERIADRLIVLHRGRVLREGDTASLVGDDKTLEEALLGWGA